MKKRKSFGVKLWLWFLLFSAAIFTALWLLQTVFLQNFYDGMAIRNVERAVDELTARAAEPDFFDRIDETAVSGSLLVFVTDENGDVLYSADEYRRLYGDADGADNPYHADGTLNWEKGALRNLPYSYRTLAEKLDGAETDRVGFVTEDGAAYVAGVRLNDGRTLSVSLPLGAVGGTVGILRVQLLWVSALSLALGFLLAWRISKRFEKPIAQLSRSAKQVAEGNFRPAFPKGFCAELDELSDTLEETASRLEKAGNAQREFLANISHDLRTPLTMIKGYAEMVKEISWSDREAREKDLDVIMREADRLTALVNEILEFSAMQADGSAKAYEKIDLSRAIRDVVEQFAPFCEQNGYTVESEIADGVAAPADESQIKRVIYNFIDNAVNHTDESKKVRVSLTAAGGSARFAVTDYGNGIADEDLPYIWDRYYTARNRKNKAVVSGLGLSVAREILTAHRAKFGVDSREHCTFWFELPALPPPPVPPTPPASPAPPT